MKTKKPITYICAPYGVITNIPAGVRVRPAHNLPATNPPQYWAQGWRGMDAKARAWRRNYGFLLSAAEVEGV